MSNNANDKASHKSLYMMVGGFALVLVIGVSALVFRVKAVVNERQTPLVESRASASGGRAGNLMLGEKFPDITLETSDGEPWNLYPHLTAGHMTVVTFHHPDCPCAESCGKLIAEMQKDGHGDVDVFGILASGYDDPRVLAALDQQRTDGIVNFPILYDKGMKVKEQLGATRTPEMWLLDRDGQIAYYGAPENSLFPGTPGHRYLLREAVEAVRAGKTPEVRSHPSIGCPIE